MFQILHDSMYYLFIKGLLIPSMREEKQSKMCCCTEKCVFSNAELDFHLDLSNIEIGFALQQFLLPDASI